MSPRARRFLRPRSGPVHRSAPLRAGREGRALQGRPRARSRRNRKKREAGGGHPAPLPGFFVFASLATPLLALLPASLDGQELRGRLFAETRVFPHDPAHPGQRGTAVSPSFGLEPELLWENSTGRLQLAIKPFFRLDAHDGRRTHFDLREASLLYFGNGWTLVGGLTRVFWGKTEANHLVDILNQTDGVEDIDGEDKLGQPLVSFTLERDWGAVDFYYLPYFRERTFAGARGRLRGAFPVLDEAAFESDAGRWHPDVAVRWTYWTGGLDVGVSAFRGTSREPRLIAVAIEEQTVPAESGIALRPRYDIIDQLSIDAQWTRGPTLWKLEALTRGGHGDRFFAAVAGVEHTFSRSVRARPTSGCWARS
ncbi:MAG: hypothetical protein R3266_15085 [Gemmatimonadota bacterium]|nr:hypothetical protein [Gemmatimonadota bacterium]